jgi:dipeptidyl aminopeptidase/acylaminoacyl peptidase
MIGRCLAVLAISLLVACGGGDADGGGGRNASFSFTPPTQAQLDEIKSTWSARDLAPRQASVYFQKNAGTYQLRIYQHTVGTQQHYGVVTIPNGGASSYPVVLFADGLDQSNPSMDMGRWEQAAQARLGQFVFVLPVFRGRTLIYNNLSLSAGGDFCDAYDGATDDSIALLNVVEAYVPQADFTHLMVRGASRGGNVALLLGARDDRVTVVAATSGPVDFYRAEVAERYGRQYRCQFFDGKTEQQSRMRMLSSSPLHFSMQPGVRRVYLAHGSVDSVVPLWNATEMSEHLSATGVDVLLDVYQGYGHTDVPDSPAFQARQIEIFEWFRQSAAGSGP